MAFLACRALCLAADAPNQASSNYHHALLGTWTLVSIYEEDASGEELDRWGDEPRGYFIASTSGHFMLQLVGRNPIRLESPEQSQACSRSAAYQSIAYAGTYVLDEANGKISLKVDDALVPEFDKSFRTSAITFEADRMHFYSSVQASPSGAFYVHLVWKRQ